MFKFETMRWNFEFRSLLSSKRRRLCAISTFVTILTIGLSLVMALVYMKPPEFESVQFEGNSLAKQVLILTHYIAIDATTGALTMDWYILPPEGYCEDEVVNIYFDRNLLDTSKTADTKIANNFAPNEPIFQFNPNAFCFGRINDSSWPTFRTVSKLIGRDFEKTLITDKSVGPSLQSYPWDKYSVEFALFAQLNAPKERVDIASVNLTGSVVNFRTVLDTNGSWSDPEGLYIHLIVKRSRAVQVLVVFIVLANWIASIAFLWITVASLLWPEEVVKELFVIPIAALFAFTSVRSNMPGAPKGFGTVMDFVGILPNIALMTISSATLLLVVLFRRTRSQEMKAKSAFEGSGQLEAQNGVSNTAVNTHTTTPRLIPAGLHRLSLDAATPRTSLHAMGSTEITSVFERSGQLEAQNTASNPAVNTASTIPRSVPMEVIDLSDLLLDTATPRAPIISTDSTAFEGPGQLEAQNGSSSPAVDTDSSLVLPLSLDIVTPHTTSDAAGNTESTHQVLAEGASIQNNDLQNQTPPP